MSSTLVEMLPRNSRASEIGVHRFLPTRQGDQYGAVGSRLVKVKVIQLKQLQSGWVPHDAAIDCAPTA